MIVSAAGVRVSLRDTGEEGYLGDRAAFAHVFFAGEYDFVLARISPGDIVLDAGSNIGCFALLASLRVGPRGLVIAVEPELVNAACLRANIALNQLTNVIVMQRALNPIPNKTVHIVGTGTTAYAEEVGRARLPEDPAAATAQRGVRTITLDGLLEELSLDRLDLIKMDIEGAERSIFSTTSTSQALAEARALAVEVHDREGASSVQNRLKAEGYAYVSQVKVESGFLINSIRRGARRPDLVLKLYGKDATSVMNRMVSGAARKPPSTAQLVGMVYASR